MTENKSIDFKKSIFSRYTKNLINLMPKQVVLSIFLMVLISLIQGISLLLLIPLLQLVGLNVGQGSIGQIGGYVSVFFTTLGLQITLINVLVLYVVVISLSAILNRLQILRTSNIEFQFAAHLRIQLYKAITNSNWLFLTKMKSSNFAHALTNEIERISVGTGQFLSLLSGLMILIVYIIFALKLAGLITGIVFITGVIILLLLRKMVTKSQSKGQEITTTTQDLYSSILQHLDGIKTIKSFDMQDENIDLFSKQTHLVAMDYIGSIKSYANVKLLFDVGTVIILAIIVIVLVEVIKLPIASLFLLIYIFVMMIPQFSQIQRSYQYFINMLPAYDNVKMLEKKCMENMAIKGPTTDKIEFKETITLENVSFSYNALDPFYIKNLNLEIYFGKTTAIIGPSGAGKSTIADIIMGLIQPDMGQIKIDDNVISSNHAGFWGNQIGYVAQDTFLFNETIRFNLHLAQPKASEKDIIGSLKLASAYDFVKNLPEGLDTFIGDRGVKLSGGERQRLALARALLRKPSLIILDEATSNLDSDNEKRILNALDELHGGITILIIAHRLSTIKNADYIYLMDGGQVLESGTRDELLKKDQGRFKDIYDEHKT